ncbi:PTS sugar transporter subunit IIA [Mycoplasma capricolum subsp. capripneumoniae]|uniref:PTS transporter subunit EIIC n=1 Tax=Mycoplasma capricolum TaxID=2095 RepID=UPI0002F2BE32|nr:PTS transporter subunit EIIC [Mycoplasma capricolum]AOQ21887.1 PTS sugar transporter subunit IIA [Mycoplasma capricolum subsp. capripneumoniae M1601]KEY84401.1 Phosphotransferase system PTS, N-acetylglucosamine-specific IIBC component [Mycoplasma capricolum subsp. capripneumoniae 99108]QDL19376.1 PTS sugar transporter subunit IIA [Mycoplasma capricolum subsp. capripneumoniae]QDL20062.1 PTS sugar transporter subunit IIA [Mycoplasma capricolum subsp. capripneumoniae]QDL20748.1 PTS sugar trans
MHNLKTKTKKDKENSFYNNLLNALQRLGKTLMFPIAVLPIAALLARFGALIQDPLANGGSNISEIQKFIGLVIATPGQIVFDNLAIIFAIGISFGLAKDNRGEAALVGGIVWFGMTALLKEGLIPTFIWKNVLTSDKILIKQGDQMIPATQLLYFLKDNTVKYQLDTGVVGGIVVGCLVALIYNKYKDVTLPQALSFFGGRRFIPMLGVLMIVPLGLGFAIVWPWAQFISIKIGTTLSQANGFAKGFAVGTYGFLNRIVQPFGLHHILNTFVWFQLPIEGKLLADGSTAIINGDITAFQKGLIGSGLFTSGFFPLFLGGLPGVALALILVSDKDKKKQMTAFYGGSAFVAWITGIDEPLIFNFIFISPILYVLNALFTGIFYMFVTWSQIALGIGFSAGFIDYVVSFWTSWQISTKIGWHANPLWIWVFAVAMFGLYFTTFYFLIKKLNIPTPGRENQLGFKKEISESITTSNNKQNKYELMAKRILDIVGRDNIELVESCSTRLRLTVKNNSKQIIDDEKIKQAGGFGVVRLGQKNYQIIIGTDVEHVADKLKEILNLN